MEATLRVEKLSSTHYVPVVTYANGAVFKGAQCVCLRQAIYSQTVGRKRMIPFVGLFELQAGDMVEITPDPACSVSERDWTWQHHGFTHSAQVERTVVNAST